MDEIERMREELLASAANLACWRQREEFQKALVRLGHRSSEISSTSSRPLRIRMFAERLLR